MSSLQQTQARQPAPSAAAQRGELLKRRVVITGMGAVTPLGNTVAETWEGICRGRSGVAPITRFDCAAFETKIAGETKGFNPLRYVTKKERRRVDDFIIYALAAAEMAMADAGLIIGEEGAERAGVIIGSAIGGLATIEKEKEAISQGGPRKMSPFTIPAVLANLAAGHVSIRFRAKGPINCTVTACASGACAIGDAARIIADGYAEVMIAGGVDAAVTPLCVAGFNAMRALSRRNDEPQKASRPFDRDRDGLVPSGGGATLILESYDNAIKRGATIFGEVLGYGFSSNGDHISVPNVEGPVKSLQRALDDARLKPIDIDYLNAHATSTPVGDQNEACAIFKIFDQGRVPVSSTKGMTGHEMWMGGASEVIYSLIMAHNSFIAPNLNFENPDEYSAKLNIISQTKEQKINTILSNSFGFGGTNSTLIVRKL